MIHCLLSGLRDRVASFLGGDLYPEGDELAELRDDKIKLTGALAESMRREQEVRRTLGQRNSDLRAVIAERDQAVIDLRDVLDLRGSNHPSRLIERDGQ